MVVLEGQEVPARKLRAARLIFGMVRERQELLRAHLAGALFVLDYHPAVGHVVAEYLAAVAAGRHYFAALAAVHRDDAVERARRP